MSQYWANIVMSTQVKKPLLCQYQTNLAMRSGKYKNVCKLLEHADEKGRQMFSGNKWKVYL